MPPQVRIYLGDKLALTIEQAAKRYGVRSLDTMRSILRRAQLEPDGQVDGRTPIYLAEAVDAAMKARLGVPGRPRKQR